MMQIETHFHVGMKEETASLSATKKKFPVFVHLPKQNEDVKVYVSGIL